DPRGGDGPEVLVEARLGVRRHARPGLRAEVLDDDLLEVAELLAQLPEREQRLDSLLARLADPDQDPARERDRELAGEANGLEPPGGDLVGRGPVWAVPLAETVGDRLEHDPHRRAHRT